MISKKFAIIAIIVIVLVSFNSTLAVAQDNSKEGWRYLKWGMSEDIVRKQLKLNNENPLYDYLESVDFISFDFEKSYALQYEGMWGRVGKFGLLEKMRIDSFRTLYFINGKFFGVKVSAPLVDEEKIYKELKRMYPSGKIIEYYVKYKDVDYYKKTGKVRTYKKKNKRFVAESKESFVFTEDFSIFFYQKYARINLKTELENIKLSKKKKEEDKLF